MSAVKPIVSEKLIYDLLAQQFGGPVTGLQPLEGGLVAQTFAFCAGGQGYIIRFVSERMDAYYDKEEFISQHYGSATVPIPNVIRVGRLEGWPYCLSRQAAGRRLDLLSAPETQSGKFSPMPETLTIQELEITTPTIDLQGQIASQRTFSVRQFTEELNKDVSLEMIEIPGGAFKMGSKPGPGYDDERPQHRVTVPSFWLGKYPVTQEQWQTLMGKPASRFKGPWQPVDNVSWKAAVRFCEQLSKRSGRKYRLPSEAEWEYACRAKTITAFSFGDSITTDLANYNGEFAYQTGPKGVYRHTTTDVGSFPPNAFGLYDTHGNLWEWCADPWHGSYEGAPTDQQVWIHDGDAPYRVARGGCWHDTPDVCRSAARLKMPEVEGDEFMGFRVVME